MDKWTSEIRKLPTNQVFLYCSFGASPKDSSPMGRKTSHLHGSKLPNSKAFAWPGLEFLQGFGRFFLLKPTPLFSASCEKLRWFFHPSKSTANPHGFIGPSKKWWGRCFDSHIFVWCPIQCRKIQCTPLKMIPLLSWTMKNARARGDVCGA